MRLSEAIRLGAMLGPQVFGQLIDPHITGSSCAVGAALRASGIIDDANFNRNEFPKWLELFPILASISEEPFDNFDWGFYSPCQRTVNTAIIRLNNSYRWKREQIADWVQSVEDSLEPVSQEQEELELVAIAR